MYLMKKNSNVLKLSLLFRVGLHVNRECGLKGGESREVRGEVGSNSLK